MRGAIGDDPDLVAIVAHQLRPRNHGAGRLELPSQAIHVVGVVVGTLAVLASFVMATATSKPGGVGMIGARQGAIRDRVAVNVFVAEKTARLPQLFTRQNLAALH